MSHGRRDRNQKEIVLALRLAGRSVQDQADLRKGRPDILVGWGSQSGRNLLIEIKMPGEKLTPDEEEFFRTWHGPLMVAYSAEEALEATGIRHDVAVTIANAARKQLGVR